MTASRRSSRPPSCVERRVQEVHRRQVNLLALIYALLGVSVLISLFGIVTRCCSRLRAHARDRHAARDRHDAPTVRRTIRFRARSRPYRQPARPRRRVASLVVTEGLSSQGWCSRSVGTLIALSRGCGHRGVLAAPGPRGAPRACGPGRSQLRVAPLVGGLLEKPQCVPLVGRLNRRSRPAADEETGHQPDASRLAPSDGARARAEPPVRHRAARLRPDGRPAFRAATHAPRVHTTRGGAMRSLVAQLVALALAVSVSTVASTHAQPERP